MSAGRSDVVLAGFELVALSGVDDAHHRCRSCHLEADENPTSLQRSQAWKLFPLCFLWDWLEA
jgi:hypothetical protein